jgi:hypothetical protein
MNVAPGPVQSWKARTGPNSIGVFLTEDLTPILLGQQSSDGTGAVCGSGTGVPPVNHAQDAAATFKLHQYPL